MMGNLQNLLLYLFLTIITAAYTRAKQQQPRNKPNKAINVTQPSWLVNCPAYFCSESKQPRKAHLVDKRKDEFHIQHFSDYIDMALRQHGDSTTDGETLDLLEHFFWGLREGISLELGALDGSPLKWSVTYDLETWFGWKRILIEGEPSHRANLAFRSPNAFSANAAICEKESIVHYGSGQGPVSGILEFMNVKFFREFHFEVFNSTSPPGDLKQVKWSNFPSILSVDCLPLSKILQVAHIHHINFFLLDVEGGELSVLKSIHWENTKFDVLCVETEPSMRSAGYAEQVTAFLLSKGYHAATGQVGRNIWYVREGFKISTRPNLAKDCFNGYEWFTTVNHEPLTKFVRCQERKKSNS